MKTIIYKSYGDTTIDEKLYRPVFEYTLPNIRKVGYLREDTLLGKIWFLVPDSGEKLIMDLSLNKGDTFYINDTHWCLADTVFSIDGNKNIVFNEPINFGDTLKFIESIGPNNLFNFLEYYPFWLENAILLCAYKDNGLVYINQNHQNCFLVWTSLPEINDFNEFIIYPNPCSGKVTIKINNPDKCSIIRFISCDGKVVIQTKMIQQSNEIDLSGLNTGFYFIHFKYEDANYFRSVIKQ